MIFKILKKVYKKFYIWKADNNKYIDYLRKQGVIIGNNCDISKTAYFGGEPWLIKIGNNTRITNDVKFITHDGGLWTLRNLNLISNESVKYGSIKIGNNCNISWNVIIMPNVTIGDNCVIAAGAVVTKDVPSNTIYGGIPAKFIESIDEYYEKVKNETCETFSMDSTQKKKYLLDNRSELFDRFK